MKTITVEGVEYETMAHHEGKKISEIKIPKGWRLWRHAECVRLHNDATLRKALNLSECWFFIQQPFKFNGRLGRIAGFGADSGWADLNCNWVATGSDSGLGVRFARDVKGASE